MMTASKYVKGCRKKRNTTKNTSGFWRKDQEEWTWNASRDGMLISEKKIYIYPIESTGKQQNVYEACKMSVWAYSDHICQRGGSAMTQNCHGLGERVNILQISYRFTCFIFSCWNRQGEEKTLLILSRFITTENTHVKFYLNFGFMKHLSSKSRWKNWHVLRQTPKLWIFWKTKIIFQVNFQYFLIIRL